MGCSVLGHEEEVRCGGSKFIPRGRPGIILPEPLIFPACELVALVYFAPAPQVGVENTGWIDILTGITAFRRAQGEYLIFVEEDYKAKVLMYRWKP